MIAGSLAWLLSHHALIFARDSSMSLSAKSSAMPAEPASQISALLNAGIIGAALGGGAVFLVMYYYGYRASDAAPSAPPPPPDPASVVAVPLPGMSGPQNKRQLT